MRQRRTKGRVANELTYEPGRVTIISEDSKKGKEYQTKFMSNDGTLHDNER